MASHTAAADYDQLILENLKSQNAIEYELGDTLDIKTSIALVVIIFLAGQSALFLTWATPLHWHRIQLGSVVCLIVSGLCAVWELIPRTYKVGLAPDQFLGWIQGVKRFYEAKGVPNPEDETVNFVRQKTLQQLRERFEINRTVNAMKSTVVTAVFILTLTALILNLATLAAMWAGWRF